MRTLVAAALALFAIIPGHSQESSRPGKFDYMSSLRESTVDAVIISTIASRVCKNMQIDGARAKMALEFHGYAGLDAIPQEKTKFFLQRFADKPEDACNFAWSRYGIGSGGPTAGSLRFLRYAASNPFAD